MRHVEKRCEKIPKSTQCSLSSRWVPCFPSLVSFLFSLAKGVTTPLSFREKRRMPLFRRLINEKTLSLSRFDSFWWKSWQSPPSRHFITYLDCFLSLSLSKDSLINEGENGERAMFLSRILRNITDISFSSNVLVFDPLYCTISSWDVSPCLICYLLLKVMISLPFSLLFLLSVWITLSVDVSCSWSLWCRWLSGWCCSVAKQLTKLRVTLHEMDAGYRPRVIRLNWVKAPKNYPSWSHFNRYPWFPVVKQIDRRTSV